MLKQKQEQKVIVNIHQEPKKKTKRRRRKPKPKPTLNPFYPERIIVPQIQMRQQPNLDFNKLIDALRVNNTSRIGNQRIQEPQAQRQERPQQIEERPPVIAEERQEPVIAERINNMPEEVEFITTEELLKSGQVNRPANFNYHQNRQADDFFKKQEEDEEDEGFRSAEEGEEKPRKIIKMKVKKPKKAEAKRAEEPEQEEQPEGSSGGRDEKLSELVVEEEIKSLTPKRAIANLTREEQNEILKAERQWLMDLNRMKVAKKKGYLPDKTEGQYRSNLKRSRRMYNYLREKANLDTVTDDFDE